MSPLTVITISVLAVAAFLNAAALGESVALKRSSTGNAVYRIGIFAVDLMLIITVSRM